MCQFLSAFVQCQPIITASGGRSSGGMTRLRSSSRVSRSLPRRGGALPRNADKKSLNEVSADHYRVGGALNRIASFKSACNSCQPIITASGGRSRLREEIRVSNRKCQPIITASGGRSVLL